MKLAFLSRTVLGFALLAGLAAPVGRAAESTPPPTPLTEADAELFFRIGEAYKVNNIYNYSHVYFAQLPKRYEEFKAMLVKAQAPAEVIADLDKFAQATLKMPWDKPWSEWSKDEQKAYNDTNMSGDLWKKWLTDGKYDRMFFMYLGRDSMSGWYGVEKNVADGNNTVADITVSAKGLLSDCDTMSTDAGYAHARSILNPDALQAIKDLAALRAVVDDPMGGGGVTQDTVTKIGTACKTLRDLNRNGKITNEK